MRHRSITRTIAALLTAAVVAAGGHALASTAGGGPSARSASQADHALPRPLARKLDVMNSLLSLLRSRLRAGEVDQAIVREQLGTVIDLKSDVVDGLFTGTLYGVPLADLVRWLDKMDICLDAAAAAAKSNLQFEFAADLLRCAEDWKRKIEKAIGHKVSVKFDNKLSRMNRLIDGLVLDLRGSRTDEGDAVRRINVLRSLFWGLVNDEDLLPAAGKAYGVPRSQLFKFLHLIDLDLEAARDANGRGEGSAAVERLLRLAQTRKENLERLLPAPAPATAAGSFRISIQVTYDHDADPQSDVCLSISTKPPRPGATTTVRLRGPSGTSVVSPAEQRGTLDARGRTRVRFLVGEIAKYEAEVTIRSRAGVTRRARATLSNAQPKGVCAPV